MTSKVFFVYLDWTLEIVPRVFYVGKGQLERVNRRERDNAHWRNIATKHGWRREVILATKYEAYAFEQEILGILELGTFENGRPNRWGANKTAGGEGVSGFVMSKDSLAKRSGSNHPFFGKKRPDSFVAQISGMNNPFYGKTHSDEWKRNKSMMTSGENHPNYGKHRTAETRLKIGVGNSHPKPALQGENHPSVKLTWELVNELRAQVALLRLVPQGTPGRKSLAKLAAECGITPGHLSNIIENRYWKQATLPKDKE